MTTIMGLVLAGVALLIILSVWRVERTLARIPQSPVIDPEVQKLPLEAARWFLNLRAQPTPERKAEFIVWLLRSPDHVKSYLITSAFLSRSL